MRRLITVLCLVPAIGACAADRARTALSDSTEAPRIRPGSTAGAVALQLWELRDSVTLRDWKVEHPDEPVGGGDSLPYAGRLGDWCAVSRRMVTVGERQVMRSAWFYPPPPPDNLALPDSVPDLVLRCRLGLMLVSVPVPDSAAASVLMDSVTAQLAQAFGAAVQRPVYFFGSAMWTRTTRFERAPVTAVTAIVPESGAQVVRSLALLPAARINFDSGLRLTRYEPVDSVPLDSAFALAAADSAIAAPLRALLRERPEGAARTPAELTRALRRWLEGTAGLPAPRRAAALYAADVVLERLLCPHGMCELADTVSRVPLEILGARFQESALGGGWNYTHNWLGAARNLDRDSPLGQRLLLVQISRGFDFSGVCAGGAEAFRKVIELGERYLARVPDSPIRYDVHYQVAEAFRDIVALARGAGDIYADSSRYGEEAGEAIVRALEHYRAALGAGPQSPVARAAWSRMWWLRAGLVPKDVRFYCIYD